MRSLRVLAVAALLPAVLSAQSSTVASGGFLNPVPVASYNMLNGGTGYYRYHDFIYPGANADADFAPLAGGLGLLTDGISATQSWDFNSPNLPFDVHGIFVGWYLNPTITFFFENAIAFSHMRVNFDIAYTGLVGPPGATTIDGLEYSTTIPVGTTPFWADFDLTSLGSGNSVTIDFTRSEGAAWLMISEVEFGNDGDSGNTSVPEPASVALLATGLLAIFGAARIRQRG
ncbi:MAG: hypothetical protein JWM95_763 [Gemmatimonadetes bacterium]|nr:hypothetical protein [Gemmatimonadota bacterium]